MKRNNHGAGLQNADSVFRSMDWRKQMEILGRQWVMRTPESEALWQNQKALCWQCVYAACMQYQGAYTYDERAEAAILVMTELEKFDPALYHLQAGGHSDSALVAYTLRLLRLKLRTAYATGIDIEYDAPADHEGNTSERKGRIALSLDQVIGDADDDEQVTYGDLLQDPQTARRDNPVIKDAAAALIFSFLAQVSNFDACQRGQRRNDTRRLHYNLCFTEQIACFAAQGGFRRILDQGSRYFRATDVEQALRWSYLDFFCQNLTGTTLADLEKARLKRRCECFVHDPAEEHRSEELCWKDSGFLEAKVPLSYLIKHEHIRSSNGEISRYREEYIADTREWAGKLDYDHTILHEIG